MPFTARTRRGRNAMSTASRIGRSIAYSRTMRTANKLIDSAVRKVKKSTIPSRNRVSKARSKQVRNVERVLKNFSGCKYAGYNGDCLKPVSKPAGTQPISYHFLNAGAPLNLMTEYKPMNLFNFPKGDGNNERVGNYMMIRKSHLKLEIQALPETYIAGGNAANQSVLQFRLIVVKANGKYTQCLSQQTDAGNSLFLTPENNEFGYDDLGESVFANMAQPINKRKWLVYRDQRFKLSPPAVTNVTQGAEAMNNTANPKYNTKKYIELELPVHKKTHFTQYEIGGQDYDVPDNLDTQWLIILQCTKGSYCLQGTEAPTNYALNVLGTTSAYDN